MPADFLPRECPRFHEQRIRFRSSLDGTGFDASGTVSYPLFGDQHEQTIERTFAIGARVMIACDPDLQRVLEA